MSPSAFAFYTLDNGLRIVVERMPGVTSAAAGFLARTGARDEVPELAGVSHYLEHMCFKGTAKRTWEQINIAFDDMAVDYNAFTSNERTFYYGWVRTADIEQQIELLADMMRSQLPPDEFDMEKKVILDEIARSNDQNMHVAYDFLHERMFEGHTLSWPVLGYDRTVADLTRDQMADYFQQRYAPDNLVLIVAGNVDPDKIAAAAKRYCGDWQPSGAQRHRQAPQMRMGSGNSRFDRFSQQIVAFAFPAPSAVDPMHEVANAAATILGGANSRFFWNIVQTGLSVDASCYRIPYCDCGLTLLWGQTDPDRCDELARAMRDEARKIMDDGVTEPEIQRVKNKRRTALAVEGEAPYYRLVQIMDDMDLRGTPRTVEERIAAVDAVSAGSIAELFERFPIGEGGYAISVGPSSWTPAA
jgi:predicted Zn-dependent peptidase